MTAKDAIAIVKSNIGDPNVTIASCKNYKTDYLVTAFKDPNELDPFYLVNKVDGSVRRYTIAEDPARYYQTPEAKI
jgi:hypothetical protein